MNTKKGFTLLELLIVIGILAILSTTIVLVINPAELLAKARDSQRISDLNTLKTAISFYLTEVSSPKIGTDKVTYSDVASPKCDTGAESTGGTASVKGKTDGGGWVPINLTDIPGGSPLSAYPTDPVGEFDKNLYYVYLTDGETAFKLMAKMESKYYSETENIQDKDGGEMSDVYEIGTKLDLGVSATSTNCFGK